MRATSVRHAPSGETISLTGQIQAKDQVNLAFRIGGRVRERNVDVGDPVAPGQVVAKIESQDYQNALRSAEADLASAQAVLANAQNTEGRQSELLSKGFTTRAQYDQAEEQMKTAQAQLESAQAKLLGMPRAAISASDPIERRPGTTEKSVVRCNSASVSFTH